MTRLTCLFTGSNACRDLCLADQRRGSSKFWPEFSHHGDKPGSTKFVQLKPWLILRHDNDEPLAGAVDIPGTADACSSEQKLGRPGL